MIKFENAEVDGWASAIRGMRNPMNSWHKSDSKWIYPQRDITGLPPIFWVGKNDIDLMKRLIKGGSDHRKFMRMIVVWVDITAPMYWWKEFDTYKVGTVRNSCSTMHKLMSKEFTLDDFSCDAIINYNIHTDSVPEEYQRANGSLCTDSLYVFEHTIMWLNVLRESILEDQETGGDFDKQSWYEMIQLLPSSYNQKSTVMLNYEVIRNMYHQRRHHKLTEWHDFCAWVETLPYAKELIIGDEQ